MSSHHFVKEGQEPALFILDPLSLELAEPLLEWAPLVMVVDTALPHVLAWGIKVDVVLVQVDQMKNMKLELMDQFPVEIIPYPNQYDLLKTAFDFLIQKSQKAVNIMTGTSDVLLDEVSHYTHKIQVTLFGWEIKWLCISSKQFEKWFPGQSRLDIRIAAGQKIQCAGLKNHQDYWETEADGIVSIHSNDLFWVGELP